MFGLTRKIGKVEKYIPKLKGCLTVRIKRKKKKKKRGKGMTLYSVESIRRATAHPVHMACPT